MEISVNICGERDLIEMLLTKFLSDVTHLKILSRLLKKQFRANAHFNEANAHEQKQKIIHMFLSICSSNKHLLISIAFPREQKLIFIHLTYSFL
jgi:hypothetical protein